ncbi:hypothetical protein RHO15_09555 [Utexia brackfieldae]
MNYYILDERGNIINYVVWDGVSIIDFGGTPMLEEEYIKLHPELFPDED